MPASLLTSLSILLLGLIDGAAAASPAQGHQQIAPLHLRKAPAHQVLELYQELSGRTIIRSPDLPELLDLESDTPLTRPQAVTVLEDAFKRLGWMTTNFGDTFVFVLPQKSAHMLQKVRQLPPKDQAEFGVVRLDEADPFQALDIYQQLSERTVLRDPNLPRTKITLRSQGALTRSEALWSLEGALLLAGIEIVPQKNYPFVFAIPSQKKVQQPKPRLPKTILNDSVKKGLLKFPATAPDNYLKNLRGSQDIKFAI